MKKLMKNFEDIMSATAFAEAGEFETARDILKGRKKILLTLTGRGSDRKSFRYALNICKRIDAGLEILYVTKGSEILGLLEHFQDELKKEKIPYEIIQGSGCIKEAIINHTEKRRDVQFVVIESSDILNIDCKEDRVLSRAWEGLKCPLVIVGT
ncbi:MAG: universal stress protein [Nitrospirota bacterium]